jgi:hypothetical protein
MTEEKMEQKENEEQKEKQEQEQECLEVQVAEGPVLAELRKLTEELKAIKEKTVEKQQITEQRLDSPQCPIRQQLESLLTEYGTKTVKELLEATTGTSGIALATMVAAKASLTMQTLVQAEKYARTIRVPKGAGKTFHVQRLGAPSYEEWTEGSALSAADVDLGDVSGTLSQFGKVTKVSDLLQYTHVLDFVNVVGELHGNTCQAAINDKVWTALKGATTNAVELGSAGDATEATVNFTAIKNAIQKVRSSKFPADCIVLGPKKFYEFVTQDVAAVQFYSALSDFFKTGRVPTILGAEIIVDPLFGDTFTGADGEIYAAVFAKGTSTAWGTDGKGVQSEIFRDPRELSVYVVSHITGGAVLVEDASVCLIKHAA